MVHQFNHLEAAHQLTFPVAFIDKHNHSQQDRSSQVVHDQRPSSNPLSQLQGLDQCAETKGNKGQNDADGGFAVAAERPLRHSPIIAKISPYTAQMTVVGIVPVRRVLIPISIDSHSAFSKNSEC